MNLPQILQTGVIIFGVLSVVLNYIHIIRKPSDRKFQIIFLASMVATAILSFMYVILVPAAGLPEMERDLGRVMAYLGLQVTQLLIAAIIITLGIGAFWFKLRNKKWYGIVEIIFGILSAAVVARGLGPNRLDLAKWSTLAGCAYIIARGLGNRDDALKESKKIH
jgi:hypothetical protein